MKEKNIIFVNVTTFSIMDKEYNSVIEEIATLAVKVKDKTYYFERNDFDIGNAISNDPTLIKKLLFLEQRENTILFSNKSNDIIYRRDTYDDISKELFKIINNEIELNEKVYIFGDLTPNEQKLFEDILLYDWQHQIFNMSNNPQIIKNLNCHKPIFITLESIRFLFKNLKVDMKEFVDTIDITFNEFKNKEKNDVVIVNAIKSICDLLF